MSKELKELLRKYKESADAQRGNPGNFVSVLVTALHDEVVIDLEKTIQSAATTPTTGQVMKDDGRISIQEALDFAGFMWANISEPYCINGHYTNQAGEELTAWDFWLRFQPFRKKKPDQSPQPDKEPESQREEDWKKATEKILNRYGFYKNDISPAQWSFEAIQMVMREYAQINSKITKS